MWLQWVEVVEHLEEIVGSDIKFVVVNPAKFPSTCRPIVTQSSCDPIEHMFILFTYVYLLIT